MFPAAVLIVDDDPQWAATLADALAQRGWQAICASEQEALELLDQLPWAAVLLDCHMPGPGGLELLRWLREHRPQVPVAMMSSHWELGHEQEAQRLGAALIWEKGPQGFSALLTWLEQHTSLPPALPAPSGEWSVPLLPDSHSLA